MLDRIEPLCSPWLVEALTCPVKPLANGFPQPPPVLAQATTPFAVAAAPCDCDADVDYQENDNNLPSDFDHRKMLTTSLMTMTPTVVISTPTSTMLQFVMRKHDDLERIKDNKHKNTINLMWFDRLLTSTGKEESFKLFNSEYMIHQHMISFIDQRSLVNSYSLILFIKES